MFLDIFNSLTTFMGNQLKAKGDRQELRRVIRQRLLAPHIIELYRKEVRDKVAEEIVIAAMGQCENSFLAAIAMFFMKDALIPMKARVISDMLAEAYPALRDAVTVTEDTDNATFRVVKGMDAVQRLVRDILTVV